MFLVGTAAAEPPEITVSQESAILQMLVLDVDSKIANDVISKTRTSESDQYGREAQQTQATEKETADGVKDPALTSRSFTMNATLGKLFVADLKKQDESFMVVSRPQVRSLIGVATALEVHGLNVSEQKGSGIGSLKIHVTPKKIDGELAVRTWLSLTESGKPLPAPLPVGRAGLKFESEVTVKCPLGSTSVMVLGNDQDSRSFVVLTDVVPIQQVEQPARPLVVTAARPLPFHIDQASDVEAKLEVMHQRTQSLMTHAPIARISNSHPEVVDVRQEAPNRISLRGLKPGTTTATLWVDDSRDPVIYRVEVLPNPSVVQVSGVQAPSPLVPPKSEVQQVLDEVREMRKLIQGLRDDMSRLRASVTQPERSVTPSAVWIQQGESQVFARGRRILSVGAHDTSILQITALAPDKLKLTGKQPGSTPLKCLFEGETIPEVFIVDVISEASRPAGQPSVLALHASPYLPGERAFHTKAGREPFAIKRGPQTDIHLRRNHVYHVKRDKPVVRVVLGSSSIVRVAEHSSNEFAIIGVEPGHTSLLVWSEGVADPELFQVTVLPTGSVVSENNVLSLTDTSQGASARKLIEVALGKETSIDIDDGTLLDAIRQLHETAGVNIAVDRLAIEEEGGSVDAKVSINVSGVSLRSVLKLLLSPLNLTVLIEDEVLKVTSKQQAEGRQPVVVYRVSDLVEQNAVGAPNFDELIRLITTVVEPESWQEVGGIGSVATNLPTSSLVIRQTQRGHEEIQQLFAALRNWTKSASAGSDLPAPIDAGVDELNGVRFTDFDSIEYSQPPLGVQTPFGSPISTDDDSLPKPVRPPGNTGAPIEAR